MKTLGQRIEHIRSKMGLDQQEFANAIGVKTSAAVSNWELDKREPDIEMLRKIAEFGGKSIEWLMTGKDDINVHDIPSLVSKKMSADDARQNFYKYLNKFDLNPFPIVSKLSAGGGLKEYFDDTNIGDMIVLPYPNKNCIVMRVDGDSMKPKIDSGDLVLIDLNKNVKNKDIVAVRLKNGEQMIKRYKNNDHKKSILLYADNIEYPPVEIGADNIEVIYKVVKIIKNA